MTKQVLLSLATSLVLSICSQAQAPSNDNCSGAISLTPANACSNTFGTCVNATGSGQTPCVGSVADDDVWYSFTTSSTGTHMSIEVTSAGGNFDPVIELFSGTCGSLTSIQCQDDPLNNVPEILTATGLSPNTTYYFRVYHYGTGWGNTGNFTVCIAEYCVAAAVDTDYNEYISQVTFNTINNATGDNRPYVDYTTANPPGSTDVYPGNTYNLTVVGTGYYLGIFCHVWFDWNIDGDFTDAGEYVSVAGSQSPFSTSVVVPATATLGATRMRVQLTATVWLNQTPPPCGDDPFGFEIEDYTVNIKSPCTIDYMVNAPYSSGSVALGTGSSNCAYSTSADHVYQVTISCAGDWTFSLCNASTNFDAYIAVGTSCCSNNLGVDGSSCTNGGTVTLSSLAAGTYYVTVYGNGASTGNYELSVYSTPICYCPAAGIGGTDWIDDVQVGSINNLNTGQSAGYYGNYTGMSTTMYVGTSYTLTVDDNPANNIVNTRLDVYIDWNQNGGFNDAGEVIPATPGPAPFTTVITPPTGTIPGAKRLRIRVSTSQTLPNACGSSGYEVEDYTIVVGAPPNDNCSGAFAMTVGQPCTTPSNETSENASNSGVPTAGGTCTATNPDDDVWYSFVAPSGGSATISIAGSSGYDPVVELFSGTCGSLTSLQCVNSTLTGGSEVLTQTGLTGGTTYYFRVYHAGAGSGTNTFTVCVSQPPANDDCSSPTTLTVNTVCGSGSPVPFSSTAATASAETNLCPGVADDDVWFSFVASATSHQIIVAGSAGYDPVVAVYDPSLGCGSLTNLACANATGTGSAEVLTPTGLTAGSTYYVRVFHFGVGWGTGDFTVYIGVGSFTVGSGTTTNGSAGYPSAYANAWHDSRQQFLIRASELIALGATKGNISNIAFEVTNTNGVGTLPNYTIEMKHTTANTLTSFDNYGFKVVYGPTWYAPVTGWNTHTVSGFCWDGTSNVLVNVCFNNSANTRTTNASVRWTNTGFAASVGSHTPVPLPGVYYPVVDVCETSFETFNSTWRPNMRFTICPIAASVDFEAVRVATPQPFVTGGSSQTVKVEFRNNMCSGSNLTSADIRYRINGGAWVTESWSGSLAPGQSTTFTFTTTVTVPVGFNTIDFDGTNLNGGTPDANAANNSASRPVQGKDVSLTPAALTWSGTDFWWTLPIQAWTVQVNGNTNPREYYVDLISPFCATVTVSLPLVGWSTTVSLTPDVPYAVIIPDLISGVPTFQTSDGISNKGLHIQSDSAITVYQIAYAAASVDGETLMPTASLGTSYVLEMTSSQDGYLGYVPNLTSIVATQNSTNIRICTFNNGTGAPQTINVSLNQGQTYRFSRNKMNVARDNTASRQAPWSSITGSIIMSDKPVAVMTHLECGIVMPCASCDIMMAQMIPVENWGQTVVTAQAIDRGEPDSTTCQGSTVHRLKSSGDFIEIVGPVGTDVTITNKAGSTVITIPPPPFAEFGYGRIWHDNPRYGTIIDPEFYGEANTIITATAPIQVLQYGKGLYIDVNDRGANTDPESIMAYPTSSWSSKYLLTTLNTLTSSITAIVIVAPTTQIANFTLGSAPNTCSPVPLPAIGWQSFGNGTYSFFRQPITPGAYRITNTADVPFGIYLDAVGQAESYIVQGGFDLDALPANLQDCHTCALLQADDVVLDGESLPTFNHLEWLSTNEVQSDHYVLERSPNSADFADVIMVEAFGSAGSETKYEFDDLEPIPGVNYYRVRVVHHDGTFEYTNVVKLEFTAAQHGVTLVPNPANTEVTVTIDVSDFIGGTLDLTVTNSFGQVVSQSTLEAPSTGTIVTTLDVSGLASGMYYFNFRGAGFEKMVKLMVTH